MKIRFENVKLKRSSVKNYDWLDGISSEISHKRTFFDTLGCGWHSSVPIFWDYGIVLNSGFS